jgi:leucyl-tRNA synthetase
VLDQRTISKMLRDLGHMPWMPDGECYEVTYTHEMVQLAGRKMSKHLGNTVTPHEIVEQVGADALRFAPLYAAAPAKAFTWDESLLTYSSAFLRRLWAFAEPRLSAASSPPDEIDLEDGLRRRLGGWCDTAAGRITENYARLDMHRATRNLMTLFERIEDFEGRVAARREPTPEDRDAVVYALRLLVRLLAPVAPHIAEELWARSGSAGFVADAGWPAPA